MLKLLFGKRRKRNRFSFGPLSSAPFDSNSTDYGYSRSVRQTPGILSQSSSVATAMTNDSRPADMRVPAGELPVYGVNKKFFNENVPSVIPPAWYFMRQPDGSMVPTGYPFYRYTSANGFGYRRKKSRRVKTRRMKSYRYTKTKTGCTSKKKQSCQSDPNCTYTRRGCRRRSTKMVYEGPSLPAEYRASGYGYRRKTRRRVKTRRMKSYRYTKTKTGCTSKKKRSCRSDPNCVYTKRGCRRRSTKNVYEGPSLEYGRRRSTRRKSGFGARRRRTRTAAMRNYRYTKTKTACTGKRTKRCRSDPNCTYTRRGCRRRSTKTVYEGPSLAYGARRKRRVMSIKKY